MRLTREGRIDPVRIALFTQGWRNLSQIRTTASHSPNGPSRVTADTDNLIFNLPVRLYERAHRHKGNDDQ